MIKHADLDIILRWAAPAGAFDVTMLYNAPGEIEDYQYFAEQPLRLELAGLAEVKDDVAAYGSQLGGLLFVDQARVLLDKAMVASESMPVHMRLLVDPKAPVGYQAIRWETICRPGSDERLTTKGNVRFCRYLSNAEGRQPTQLARVGNLRALVAVANPTDIRDYTAGPAAPLTAVAIDVETQRARDALGNMAVTVLAGDGGRATRRRILDALRDDIQAFYLVCHGRLTDSGPQLFLEDEQGGVDVVDGAAFAADVADLDRVPTIAILCSCQSGGPDASVMTSTAESLTALGPAMAQAGVAVVVAMQGNVRMATAAQFLTRFFEELDDDGIPARAMAVARSTISDQPDWFMPVLYSRLKRGSAWYLPRFGGREGELFPNLQTRIAEGHCTPIIGSGVASEEGVLPTRQQLAEGWAERRQMPISESSRNDLASVAQYVSVDGGRGLPRDELSRFVRSRLRAAHAEAMPDLDWDFGPTHDLIREVARHNRVLSNETDSYSRLARLNAPVYITTSWTSLLEDALQEAGKRPVVRHFDWYEDRQRDIAEDDAGPSFRPDAPLVYHLFGTLDVPRSLVLTEDDYFTWLRAWTKEVDKGSSIPHYVKTPLTENALVFLGYVFDDWEFRGIFQAIKGFLGIRLAENNHVGVQIEPETLRIEREAAQEYLEGYFGADHIDIYWSTCGRFLEDLSKAEPR